MKNAPKKKKVNKWGFKLVTLNHYPPESPSLPPSQRALQSANSDKMDCYIPAVWADH